MASPCDFSVAQAYFARKAWLSGYWFRAIISMTLRCPALAQSGQRSSLFEGGAANQNWHRGHCRLTMPEGGSHSCALMARADASSKGCSSSGASYWWL